MQIAGSKNVCPLCDQEKNMGKKAKSLYGYLVCKKCYYSFANRRQFAFVIDSFFWRFGAAFLMGVLARIFFRVPKNYFDGTIADLFILPIMLLLCFKDGFGGYSIGKVMMGVQVIDRETRSPIGFSASFKRNLPVIIPIVPIIIAGQLCGGKRWGDGWAGTKVIWAKYKDKIPFSSSENGPHKPTQSVFLITLFVVIFIIGLLAAIAIPNFIRAKT